MRHAFIILMYSLLSQTIVAQNVGIGTANPHPSSALDITDTARGILIPRMTMAQRLNIAQPAEGLMVYQTDSTKGFWHWDGTQWKTISQTNSTPNAFSPQRMTYAQRNALLNPLPGSIIYCTDCGTRGQAQIFDGYSSTWTDLNGGVARGNVFLDSVNNTVTIGTQTWSTKNLNVARYRNGDPIPQVTDPNQWTNLTTGAWCWYNNDSATYGSLYGRLYNWYAVNDPRGLAPQGWRIPTESDWNRLVMFIDPTVDSLQFAQSTYAGGVMKSITGWTIPNTGATNTIGFDGLPGGYLITDFNPFFSGIGFLGIWWSSEERRTDTRKAWLRYIVNNEANINKNTYMKTYGLSVRVVRD